MPSSRRKAPAPARAARPAARPRRRPAGRRTTAADPQLVAAFQRLVGEVFRLNGQLLATAEGLARGLDVTPGRWQAIAAIRHEPLTVAEISRRIGVRRQSAQHNVNLLLEQGLVELRPNPGHRRASLVALLPAGVATMQVLHGLQAQLTAIFNEGPGLSAGQLEAQTATLATLRRSAEAHDADGDRRGGRP